MQAGRRNSRSLHNPAARSSGRADPSAAAAKLCSGPFRRLFTRLLLCAHVFCLLLVLCGMAAVAQPDHENQSVDEMLTELSGPGVNGDGGSPFKAFARRAQMVITGLVHISVLLLPRQLDEAGASSSSASKAAGGSSASGSTGSANAAAELAAAGFPSDGSNFEDWQQVRGTLAARSTACVPALAWLGAAVLIIMHAPLLPGSFKLTGCSQFVCSIKLHRSCHVCPLPAAGAARSRQDGHWRGGLGHLLRLQNHCRGWRCGGARGRSLLIKHRRPGSCVTALLWMPGDCSPLC